ncbi:MAG TPA: hypothetical protein VI248_04870 [Kineosporiaceae bacterium]
MSAFGRDVDPGFDTLAPWIARRHRGYRLLAGGWLAAAALSGLLVLVRDELVLLPLAPIGCGAAWAAWHWISDRWWAARCHRAGHPVVRADLCWTVAAGRRLPPGWLDAPLPGELHRTPEAWTWRPSHWVTFKVPSRSWPADDVAAVTITPVGDAVAGGRAQLRLYLHGGATADLLVRSPARLLWMPPPVDHAHRA